MVFPPSPAAGLGKRGALAVEVIGDAACAHRVIANACFDAGPFRMALDHPVGVLLRQAVRRAG
jgi:hypothetical protein